MTDCKPTSLPANPNNRPSPTMAPKSEEERLQMEKTPLREAIGSLMYLMATTRPDIALAVNQVAAFVSNPGPDQWEATKQIFSYLAGTANYGIFYGGPMLCNESSPLHGFTDANFAEDLVACKSTTGILFTFHGGPISWGSRLQQATALSTTDAEFYAASEGTRETVWLKALLTELDVNVGKIPIHCDSRCAISIIEDPENHQRVKHIEV
ncbi:secreted RxLR effector protein 161-like [Daphnia magna]|uniref:secreted RxLR effector protein 161-like n=1 Tax=Daphnia magna TaxID=35525 RepID=UPI0014029B2A|nr:secreted RxLR effector protein 161-like [Daphnia magna]